MADQNAVLRAIVNARDVVSVDDLCLAVLGKVAKPASNARKGIIKLVCALSRRKLVVAVDSEAPSFPNSQSIGYVATAEGKAFVAAGKVIKSGPKGRHTGVPKARPETFRDRIWTALRYRKKATIFELIEIARAPGNVKTAATNARRYLKALQRVHVVKELDLRAAGYAPTSNGFIRYALLRDLGPKPPVACDGYIFDPNANERIPFAAAKKSEAA